MRFPVPVTALILTFLLAACKEKGPSIPRNQMEQILLDVYTAETLSGFNEEKKTVDKKKDMEELSVYYSSIFAHYRVSREEFLSSMQWYFNHPAELDSIYRKVSDRIRDDNVYRPKNEDRKRRNGPGAASEPANKETNNEQ